VKVTGHLTFEDCSFAEAALVVAGELAGRWREMGWDVDEVTVTLPDQDSDHPREEKGKMT
jgi:hypothetical protein